MNSSNASDYDGGGGSLWDAISATASDEDASFFERCLVELANFSVMEIHGGSERKERKNNAEGLRPALC
jgi:hypothetical protein